MSGDGSLFAARENVRFAGIALTAHKLRSALTVLGIVIGVTTVIAMVSIIEGFNNSVVKSFQSFGATLVQFQKYDPRFGPGDRDEAQRQRKNLTYEDALALKAQCPSMLAVSPERYTFQRRGPSLDRRYNGKQATPDALVGATDRLLRSRTTTTSARAASSPTATSAAPPPSRSSATSIAEALFPHSDPIGKDVTVAGRKYVVVGVMEKQGASYLRVDRLHVYHPASRRSTARSRRSSASAA